MDNIPMIRHSFENTFVIKESPVKAEVKIFKMFLYELIILMTSPVSAFGSKILKEFINVENYFNEQRELKSSAPVDFVKVPPHVKKSDCYCELVRQGFYSLNNIRKLPPTFIYRDIYNLFNTVTNVFTDYIPYRPSLLSFQDRTPMIPVEIGNVQLPYLDLDLFKEEAQRLLGFKVSVKNSS
jgi:hypothetical protein